jgi:hypothetical protein
MLVPAALIGTVLSLAPQLPGKGLTFEVGLDSSGQFLGASTTSLEGPAMSSSARFVAFEAVLKTPPFANQIYVRDRQTGITKRVSNSPQGLPADRRCEAPSISDNGRYVLYLTRSTNLVPSMPTKFGYWQLYWHDRQTGATEIVSVDSTGASVDSNSFAAKVSNDGRWIAFANAGNVVPGDTNGRSDVFLRDRHEAVTRRVSVAANGGNTDDGSLVLDLSADGRHIAFASAARNISPLVKTNTYHAYVHDRVLGLTELVSLNSHGEPANAASGITFWFGFRPSGSISDDGRVVAFGSSASNLSPGATIPQESQVYVRDRATGVTEQISTYGSSTGPFLSPDGRFLAYFVADGSGKIYLYDRATGGTELMSIPPPGGSLSAPNNARAITLSADGNQVLFEGAYYLWIRDRSAPKPTPYCPPEPHPPGCTPTIWSWGHPSRFQPSGFRINANQIVNNRHGQFFYGVNGAAATPFKGSQLLCVAAPHKRVPGVQRTHGGKPSPTLCTGWLSMDFNTYMAKGIDPSLVLGTSVWLQGWVRLPGSADGLTGALAFVVLP